MSRSLSQYQITYLNGPLGLVATGRRDINTGNEFDAFYPARKPKEEYVMVGNSYNTLDLMIQRIRSDHHEASKIASKLYSPDLGIFTKRIFDHIYQNFQYKQDPANREQVKGVAGSYDNRISGIDCDDMAFLTGTILYNKGISFAIRKTSKSAHGDFSHVYIVVPKSPGLSLKNRSNYYVIDPVLDQNNFEYPKNKVPQYYDEVLVTPNNNKMNGISCDCGTLQGVEDYNLATKEGWENLRAAILSGTEMVPGGLEEVDFIEKTNLLISAWDDPDVREYVIAVLLVDEELSEYGLQGMDGLFKKVFKGVKRGGKAVGKAVSKVSKVVKRGAPPLILAREGIKLWFRKLGRKKAGSLWIGYYTEQQAKSKGIDLSDWRRRVDRKQKVEKLFKGIGGSTSKLQDAIYDGAKAISSRKSWFLDKNTVNAKRVTSSSSRPTATTSSTSSAKSAYMRYKAQYDIHKRSGRNSTANRYADLANRYAKTARLPVLPKLSAFSVGPRVIHNARPQVRPVVPPKPSRVSPAPPRRGTTPTRNVNLIQYNRYKSLYDRYKVSSPSTANRYADLANRYAKNAGQSALRRLPGASSSTHTAVSQYNRYKSLYDRYKSSNPANANRYASMANRYAKSAKKPLLRQITSSASKSITRGATPTRFGVSTSRSSLTTYNRYKSLYQKYQRTNPALANRYASMANRYAKSANQPVLRTVSVTRALKSGLRGIMTMGLGEPITVAASTAAAAPFIVKIVELLKGISDDPKTIDAVSKAVSSSSKKSLSKKISKVVSKKTKGSSLVKTIKKELDKKPILKNTLSTITKKQPTTSRPPAVSDNEKRRILNGFDRYNKLKKRTWDSMIVGHLNATKNPTIAKRDPKRAAYAKSINYSPAVAKRDALRFGLLQPQNSLDKAIKSKIVKKSTPTPPKELTKRPKSTNASVQEAAKKKQQQLAITQRNQIAQQKSIDEKVTTKMVLGGLGIVALGTTLYVVSNKGSKMNGPEEPAAIDPDTMNGPKKSKATKPKKTKKTGKTTIVIQ